jgi:hypothetical protein
MKQASKEIVSSLIFTRMNERYKKQRCIDCQQRGPKCYCGNGTGRREEGIQFSYAAYFTKYCSTNEIIITSVLKHIYINI